MPSEAELSQLALLTPTADQQRISRRVVYELQTGHLEGVTIDDALSSKLLDELLEFLDPNRR